MRKHGFSVGLLTEMEPLANTASTHEGTTRLLGLNRNAGEVIELRLRTDAGDGYRAYNTIRATLCHELAHNVYGPHDGDFWRLCRQIEREVAAAGRGRSLEGELPPTGWEGVEEEGEVMDHGGWTGGSHVLGGGGVGGSGTMVATGEGGLSRRDVIAKAAEERMRRAAGGGGGGSGSAPPENGEGGEGGGSRAA